MELTDKNYIKKIIIIQQYIKQYLYRLHHLPPIFYDIKAFLEKTKWDVSSQNKDGRINSCIDEDKIISILSSQFKIKIPSQTRMWYDILVYDSIYGWLPVNIKTTEMKTSDNTGNMAMCIQAYTDEILDLNKSYNSGEMSDILFTKLKNKQYNKQPKKDYYFIVINKLNISNVIINSVLGLTKLTPNVNNLPFQVNWKHNTIYKYDIIDNKIKQFIECLKSPKPSWQERFMSNIRTINI